MTSDPVPAAGPARDAAGNPLRLLFVHAHPDDETTTTGATVRHYAEQGVGVHLVTCTRGERGEILDAALLDRLADPDPDVLGERLAGHRLGELAAAGRALGFTGRRLLGGAGRWWDSGGAGQARHERAFADGDLAEQADELARVVRELRPQVVVSYDERGGYGHPDHIRAHQVTVAGVGRAADPSAPAELGPVWTVGKVYAGVVPRSGLRRVAQQLGGLDLPGGNPFAAAAALNEEALARLPFGVPDELIAARIDAQRWLPAKIAAMRAHRSQMHPEGWFFVLANNGGFGVEHYQLLSGRPGPARPDGVEEDLFAGIRAT